MLQFTSDWVAAGRLIQWGLDPHAKPVQELEYQELIEHYVTHHDFRQHVGELARGLGLEVLDASSRGFVLAPREHSVFALKPADYRSGTGSADARLLDGLAQVAIAATVFPRSADLEEDPAIARPPVTVDEIESTIRSLCCRIEQELRGAPDTPASVVETGLLEAWRVYINIPDVRETKGKARAPRSTTRRLIESNLELLASYACFTRVARSGELAYQPTYRYQRQVQELAAGEIYDAVCGILAKAATSPDSAAQPSGA